jgi:hypothetical protein
MKSSLAVGVRAIVVHAQRFTPALPSLSSPKPATTTSRPPVSISVSHPMTGGVIGTSVTGSARRQNAQSSIATSNMYPG